MRRSFEMKSILIVLLILLIPSFSLFSQEQVGSKKKAKTIASKEDKNILLVFAGSDWCIPCMKLQKRIWSSKEFQKLARDDFVMLKANFPRRKENKLSKDKRKRNNRLADQYNPKGYFPFIVILNSEGNALGRTGYKDLSPKKYYQHLLSFVKKE